MIRKAPKPIKHNTTPAQYNGRSPLSNHYNITPQEALFIAEYTKDWDELIALKQSGLYPSNKTKKQARQTAYTILAKPAVSAALAQAVEYKVHRTLISKDMILSHMAKIANADVSQAYDYDGSVKHIKAIPYDLRCAISEIKTKTLFGVDDDGNKVVRGYTTELKLESKLSALKELLKALTPPTPDVLVQNNTINNISNLSHLDIDKTNELLELINVTPKDPKLIELEAIETCNLDN